ncbi:MAG: L-cystine transport system ATP-binding protein [Blastocatellia bacterium]|jgi:ABC-type polar amino acid transport system ATPase subunit|nr:L-cystine transport system ATP-binding protein [Blastocatellia bacterium]
MIRVTDLIKQTNGTRILRGVSFEVGPQTVLGVIGASGSGKTTLLRCLNGLERIDGGKIECENVHLDANLSEHEYSRRVKELRRKVGTVFQHLYLFPHLTVLGNIIEAPTHVLRVARKKAESEAYELLESVGLRDKARRYPESLSGGEQQRVAIARALAMHPALLMFDEPTSALDPKRSAGLRSLLRGFVTRGHTMVIVSHSIGFLEGLADQLLYMEGGEVVEFGETERILNSPQDPRTKDFVQQAQ